jgi:hypothetical protein
MSKNDLTLEEIVRQYPHQYTEGMGSDNGATNPYPQSLHFQVTVDDCKHIAWREGNLRVHGKAL